MGYETIRRAPLQLRAIPDGWQSELGQQLYETLRPTVAELRWVVAHECAHIKHEDGLARGLGLGLGLLAYHATTKLLWRRLGAAMHRGSSAGGVRGALVLAGPLLVGLAQVQLARQQEYAADRAAGEISAEHARAGISHLERILRYNHFRRDHLGDGQVDESGDMKSRWVTHPPTEARLAELRAIAEGFEEGAPRPAA